MTGFEAEVKTVKIMGHDGGLGSHFGNIYEGYYSVTAVEGLPLLKFTAVNEGTKRYKTSDSDQFISTHQGNCYRVPEGSVFYVSPSNIQEMS